MSLLKKIGTEIKGNKVEINLPNKKSIILRGRNALQLMYVAESLLRQDFTSYFSQFDKQFGYKYDDFAGTSYVTFNDGAIVGKSECVQLQGVVPAIHVIRYIGGCNKIRSAYMTQTLNSFVRTGEDMTKYSHIIDDTVWFRLIESVNSVLGFVFVTLEDGKLKFNFNQSSDIGVDGQEIVYLLLAECTLTPEGYHRILLLPEISCLPKRTQVKLLEMLDNFRGHSLTLSLASIQPSDLSSTSVISFLNV